MDRKHFWFSPNRSVDYDHPRINQLHIKDNYETCLKLNKKRKISLLFDEIYWNSDCKKFKVEA